MHKNSGKVSVDVPRAVGRPTRHYTEPRLQSLTLTLRVNGDEQGTIRGEHQACGTFSVPSYSYIAEFPCFFALERWSNVLLAFLFVFESMKCTGFGNVVNQIF